ncbi:serine/threonine-protein kinase mos [Stomoxys calcitrans]|uniref:non-specific serine/threonine protein kinase n=1 Tax=Stomoxys calcitrans TaxID=35570 RepID=A0A1I8NPQ4_STOCA|nr:serine/threonine-protein kinase mos [Stomoxys calcitrans]
MFNGKMSLLFLQTRENELILNTPKREELLKDGPPSSQVKNNLLGRGAYGTVIKAIYKAKPVAVKIIKNHKDVNNQIMLNEAHILDWKHRNIVKILKIESTPNFGIVIMERFNGECLQNALNNMDISVVHRICIAMDLTSALMYCHKKQILHMDVKPQNVMIVITKPLRYAGKSDTCHRSYTCKLCDFGSSMKFTKGQGNIKGSVKGTLRYMAPETLKEECLTPAADVYSLGITLWQMKYRILPYFWLKCNEIVAYQVVKNQLRPHNIPANETIPKHSDIKASVTTNSHGLCLCENSSKQMSSQSLEDILKVLQSNECEFIATTKPNEAIIPFKRMPLKEFNNNHQNVKQLKAKRDLHYEFVLTETFTLQNVLGSVAQEMDMARKIVLEQLYDDIYQSCWHDDFKQRPATKELYDCFKEML